MLSCKWDLQGKMFQSCCCTFLLRGRGRSGCPVLWGRVWEGSTDFSFLPLYYFVFMIQIYICTFCIFIVNIKCYYYDAYDVYGYMLGFYDPGLWVTKFVENCGDFWDRITILMLIHQCGSLKETKPESWHEFRVWE